MSLRYHHSASGGAGHTRTSSHEPIYRSSLQSLMGSTQPQPADTLAEGNVTYQHVAISSAEESSIKPSKNFDAFRKEFSSSWFLPTSLSYQENNNLEANLEDLLTVFPKPPQSKFEGFFSPQKPQIILNKKKNGVISNSKNENPPRTNHGLERKRYTTSNNLTASVSATLRRNCKHAVMSNKSTTKQYQSKSKASEIATAFSTSQTNFCKPQTEKPFTNILRSFDVGKLFSSWNDFSLSQPYDNEFSLLSEGNTRWMGSLGSLYKTTPKEFASDSKKFEKSDDTPKMLDSSLLQSMGLPTEGGHDLMYSTDQPLMSASPLDSLSAFVA